MKKHPKQNMTTLGKVGNTFLDFAKGFTQIMTFWGGPFGFISGGIYGAINGYQTCVNNNISFVKNPIKFIGTLISSICVGAASGSVPFVGPLLMGATGSAVDQVVSKTIGINSHRKFSKKEMLISAIPFIGPIIAGYKRNKKLKYTNPGVRSPGSNTPPTSDGKGPITAQVKQAARDSTTVPTHPTGQHARPQPANRSKGRNT